MTKWIPFKKESKKLIIDAFVTIERIRWDKVHQHRRQFYIGGDMVLPYQKHNCDYLEKYKQFKKMMAQANGGYLSDTNVRFPQDFRHTHPSTKLIFTKGNTALLDQGPKVAIVGTRRPTAYGRKVTTELSRYLSENGIVIISGLAMGIDALAHAAALEGRGNTIAILAQGIGNVYPKVNAPLYERIQNNDGLFISENVFFEAARPYDFPLRNRLISALADVVIIVEGAEKSGTMLTAIHALEQGKSIFAVPGSIFSEQSRGVNRLIGEGAMPLLEYKQILDYLNILPNKQSKTPVNLNGVSEHAKGLYSLIEKNAHKGIDELFECSKLEYSEFYAALSELILEDLCERVGLNAIQLK